MTYIKSITLDGENDNKKYITFEKDGKYNINQFNYFNALFNPDLTVKTDYNEFSYFGAFRCAKSFSQQAAIYILADMYPKLKVVIVRDTFDQLELSVIKQFNEEFQFLGTYDYYESKRKAVFHNGSVIYFRAFDVDTNILSAEYDVIAACQLEDIPEELFLQFFGRLSGQVLPKPLLLVEGNPASGYVKSRYKDATVEQLKNLGIFAINNGRTSDNPFLRPEYIERIKANYPAFWVARYLDSEWNSIDEMVYSEFREQRHVIDPINPQYIKHLKQRGGFDYAWRTNSAMNWAFVDFDGDIVIYDEWFMTQASKDVIKKESKRHNYQDNQTGRVNKIQFVTDYSIKRPDRDGRSLWDDLTSGEDSMNLVEANKDELNNIQLTNMLLKQDRLKITRNCVNTIKEISGWKWKKQKLGADRNAPDEPVDKDNHHCDNINYIVSNLEGTATANPQLEAYKKSVEYANVHGRSQYATAGVS